MSPTCPTTDLPKARTDSKNAAPPLPAALQEEGASPRGPGRPRQPHTEEVSERLPDGEWAWDWGSHRLTVAWVLLLPHYHSGSVPKWSLLPPCCHFLLSWLETKSGSMGAIHMMSLQFTATASLLQSVWNTQKDQFFPKMVKKCLGSILLPEKHSLLYLSMLLRQELFTLNKNRRNGGRRKISNSPVCWRLAGWNSTGAGSKPELKQLTFQSHRLSGAEAQERQQFCALWIKKVIP